MNRKPYIQEAASMVGALVKTSSTANGDPGVQIVVAYMTDAKGEWIRFIKDGPDNWRALSHYTVLSMGH